MLIDALGGVETVEWSDASTALIAHLTDASTELLQHLVDALTALVARLFRASIECIIKAAVVIRWCA